VVPSRTSARVGGTAWTWQMSRRRVPVRRHTASSQSQPAAESRSARSTTEYRAAEKLHGITKKIVDGEAPRDRYRWRERYCVDQRSRVVYGPEDHFEIPPTYRLWLWPADVQPGRGRAQSDTLATTRRRRVTPLPEYMGRNTPLLVYGPAGLGAAESVQIVPQLSRVGAGGGVIAVQPFV
jgi:hypothetical protein